jgi:hypothetical protein
MTGRRRKNKLPPKEVLLEMLSFLHASRMDKTADYLRRGRTHSSLSESTLFEEWKVSVRQMAVDPFDAAVRLRNDDLTDEITLRDLKPPEEDVEAEFETFIAKLNEQLEKSRLDPEAHAESVAALDQEFEAFQSKKRSGN